jgi:hypothetical protein
VELAELALLITSTTLDREAITVLPTTSKISTPTKHMHIPNIID